MKKTNYTIGTQMMSAANLKQAIMLKKYGIDKPSEFEIGQLSKLGLTDHLKGVVATDTGVVLCNWDMVQIAKAAGIDEIEVIVIEGLTEDEIPQVIAVKNIRKGLSKKATANLIVEYRDYLTKNETGKAWADEVPGDSTDAKIGTLIGYSYGMINGYQSIYKNHPEFLDMIDDGDMSYTYALQIVKDENQPAPTGDEMDNTPIVPVKTKAPKHNYAGERNMVACEPVESIQIRYADGKTIDVVINGENGSGHLCDKAIEMSYTPKKEAFDGGAEFHRLDFADNRYFIELVIKKAA